jgi:hypothetical protein
MDEIDLSGHCNGDSPMIVGLKCRSGSIGSFQGKNNAGKNNVG